MTHSPCSCLCCCDFLCSLPKLLVHQSQTLQNYVTSQVEKFKKSRWHVPHTVELHWERSTAITSRHSPALTETHLAGFVFNNATKDHSKKWLLDLKQQLWQPQHKLNMSSFSNLAIIAGLLFCEVFLLLCPPLWLMVGYVSQYLALLAPEVSPEQVPVWLMVFPMWCFISPSGTHEIKTNHPGFRCTIKGIVQHFGKYAFFNDQCCSEDPLFHSHNRPKNVPLDQKARLSNNQSVICKFFIFILV